MKKVVFFILCLCLPIFASSRLVYSQSLSEGVYIKRITIAGFLLRDKKPIEKMIKANQKKWLTHEHIQKMIEELKVLYVAGGYTGLVDISYTIERSRLIIKVLLLRH
jgi:outer membrane protein assembly factor BamA